MTSGSVATLGTGAVVSVTTIRCVCVAVFPWPSSKCQVTIDVPWVVRVSGADAGAGGVDVARLDRIVAAAKPAHVPHTVEVVGP